MTSVGGAIVPDRTQLVLSKGMVAGRWSRYQEPKLVEVFNPPWWRVDRWIWWLFKGRRSRVSGIAISHAGQTRMFKIYWIRRGP